MEEILRFLNITELANKWVTETWASSLNDAVLPTNVDYPTVKQLKKLASILKSGNHDVSVVSLPLLSYISAIIAKLAEWHHPDESDFESCGLVVVTGIECYFHLLAIPRATAYNGFHPVLFEQCLKITKTILQQQSAKVAKRRRNSESDEIRNCVVVTAMQDKLFPAMSKMFNEFRLPVEYADRPVDDMLEIARCSSVLQLNCTSLRLMFVTLAGQKVCSRIVPQLIVMLNGKIFVSKTSTLTAAEKRMWKFAHETAIAIAEEQPVIGLQIIKSIVYDSPDRQLNRRIALEVIADLFKKMALKEQQSVIDFAFLALKSEKVRQRSLAIELVKILLLQETLNDVQVDPSTLLNALAGRTRDVSNIVQARALTALSVLLEGSNITAGESILAPGALQPSFRKRNERESIDSRQSLSSQMTTASDADAGRQRLSERALALDSTQQKLVRTFYNASSGSSLLSQLLLQRNQMVRKAALIFLKSLVVRQIIPLDDEVIRLAKNACQDKLLSVRRNGIIAFTQLMVKMSAIDQTVSLNVSTSESNQISLRLEWLQMILEKLHDMEKTVKEESISMLYEHFIEPIIKYPNNEMWDALHEYPAELYEDFERDMSLLIKQLISDQKLSRIDDMVKNIWHQFEMHDGNFVIGWILLKILYLESKDKSLIDQDTMCDYFLSNIGSFTSSFPYVAQHVFKFMAKMTPNINDIRDSIFEECRTRMTKITTDNIQLTTPIAQVLRVDDIETVRKWVLETFQLKTLKKQIIKFGQTNNVDNEYTRRWQEIVVRATIFSEFIDLLSSTEIDEFSTMLLGMYYQNKEENSFNPLPDVMISALLHIQCRVCSISQEHAEYIMPFFGNELQKGRCSKSRTIALSALADLCQVKTQLVDKFLDVIAATLDDSSNCVRSSALHQLTNLLKKDFVKLRPSILCRMLIQAADLGSNSKVVAEKASFCLKYVLLPRNPKLFYQYFTEIMMLATGAQKIDGHNENSLLSTQTQAAYSDHPGNFPGKRNRLRRHQIYNYCIENMDESQRVFLLGKLCSEVLDAPQQHGQINTSDAAVEEIIYDSIWVLHKHPLLQFDIKGNRNEGADPEEEFDPDAADNARRAVTKQKLSAARTQIIKLSIFPVLYDLRETTRLHKSTVQPYLLRLMADWLKSIPDLVACDRKYVDLADAIEVELQLWGNEEPTTTIIPDLETVEDADPPTTAENLNQSLRNLNVSLMTPTGAKRRRTFGGSSFANMTVNSMPRDSQRRSLSGKPMPISTPFHTKGKSDKGANLARASLGSGISDISQGTNKQFHQTFQTDNTGIDDTLDSDASFIINKK